MLSIIIQLTYGYIWMEVTDKSVVVKVHFCMLQLISQSTVNLLHSSKDCFKLSLKHFAPPVHYILQAVSCSKLHLILPILCCDQSIIITLYLVGSNGKISGSLHHLTSFVDTLKVDFFSIIIVV